MQECPYCGFELNGAVQRDTTRSDPSPGQKSTEDEIVSCPDCGEVIDGFASH